MRYIISLLLALLVFLSVQSQNWRAFYPNDTAYYLDADWALHGLAAVDSIVVSNIKSCKLHRTAAFGTLGCPSGVNTNVAMWCGPAIDELPNGDYRFFNANWDTILVNTTASLNDSWVFYAKTSSNYLLATIESIDTATIANTLDSVKTIRLTFVGIGDAELEQWDSTQLVLSKHHGMVRMPHILSFPINYRLLALTDKKPLTYGAVYDYQVGDYFQIYNTFESYDGISTTVTLHTVLNKSITNSGAGKNFLIKRERQYKTANGSMVHHSTDTVLWEIDNVNEFVGSGIPNAATTTNNTDIPFVTTRAAIDNSNRPQLNGRRTARVIDWYYYTPVNDTCWQTNVAVDGYEPPFYFECLGLLYQRSGGLDGILHDSLVYYSLCGQQGGAKVILGVAEIMETHVSIAPNPASGRITINNTSHLSLNAQLLALDGQVMDSYGIGPSSEQIFSIDHLSDGFYILQLKSNETYLHKKIIIVR